MENRPVRFGVFQFVQSSAQFGIAVVLVVYAGQRWEGPVLALVVSSAAFAAVGILLLNRAGGIRFRFGMTEARHALWFGVPLLPHALGGMLIVQIDRVFITNMVGIDDTGIYSVGYQMAYVVELIAYSFNQAYVPWLYGKLAENRPSEKERIVKYTYLYFGAIIVLALLISLMMPWFLGFFVGKKFAEASRYTFWIALGFAFSGMYYMVANYIFFSGKTHIVSWATLISLLTNISLNYFLIRWNGAVGAAQASACSFFLLFIVTWYLSARVYRMPWIPGRAKG
jgi:O-antigen/teichoic acid export membrane protein